MVARERQGNDAFLAAFLLGEPEAVDLAELKQALRSETCRNMVPAHFAWSTASLHSLAASATTRPARTAAEHGTNIEYLAPRDDYERTPAGLLGEIAGSSPVGIRDSFFLTSAAPPQRGCASCSLIE
ncbi:hypothetical protein ACPA9J_31485 [Pseudomonas aeruginosa]